MKRRVLRAVDTAPGDVPQPRRYGDILSVPQQQDALVAPSGVVPTTVGADETSADAAFVSRSYFSARFNTEILRAQRQGHALTLVLVDPDDGGEAARPDIQLAELCRRVLSKALPAQLRGFDVMAQWTDTTVALLLLDSDRTGAAAVLQRLAKAMAGPHLPGRRLCLRAGIATYPRDGRTAHDLWERALVSLRGDRPA